MKRALFLFFIVFYIPIALSDPELPPWQTAFPVTPPGSSDGSSATTAGNDSGTDGSDRGINAGHVTIGSSIIKNLASLAFDAEDSQKITGTIDIATGGYLIPKNCPPPYTPDRVLMCIYGISAVANGAASLKSSRRSEEARRNLGGDATNGKTTSGQPDSCDPFTDPNCRIIHCTSQPNSPVCRSCLNGPCPPEGRCPDGTICGSDSGFDGGSDGGDDGGSDGGDDGGSDSGDDGGSDGGDDGGSDGGDDGGSDGGDDGGSDGGDDGGSDGDISCDVNPNQAKCRADNPENPRPDDPCIDILGTPCDEVNREACQQLSSYCRITPPDNNPVFYDLDGNPINPGPLDDIGRQLRLPLPEIKNIEEKIKDIQQNVRSQMDDLGDDSSGGSNNQGRLPLSTNDESESLSVAGKNSKPSLSNGGGISTSAGNRRSRTSSSGFSRKLQSLLDRQKNNHQSSIKKHGYKPAKLGSQPIGTTHDNIFDMMSRGYQARENSLNIH